MHHGMDDLNEIIGRPTSIARRSSSVLNVCVCGQWLQRSCVDHDRASTIAPFQTVAVASMCRKKAQH